jgi:hypothetical protein
MRITDEDPEEGRQQPSPNQILSQIKTTSQVGSTNEVVHSTIGQSENRVVADVNGAKLKSLLSSLKKQN